VNVFPDGGVSRLRVWGVATQNGRRAAALRRINTLFHAGELRKICGSRQWAKELAAARPFATWDELRAKAETIWNSLTTDAHLEAFGAHPRIGERKPGWSAQEQAGVSAAAAATMDALAQGNRAYEEKFGFVYLVCATGKTADEMLAILNERLTHDRDTELRIAADEHRKITELRLEKF
jgi:allantoicase